MCIARFNPTEPCCADQCSACPTVDWNEFTWRLAQPQAAESVTATGYYPNPDSPGTFSPVVFETRYRALSELMSLDAINPCRWFAVAPREARVLSGSVEPELFDWHPLSGWYSSTSLKIDGNWQNPWLSDYWFAVVGLEKMPLYALEDAGKRWSMGHTRNITSWAELLEYSPDFDRFDCNGSNLFTRDTPDPLFPEWLRVTLERKP